MSNLNPVSAVQRSSGCRHPAFPSSLLTVQSGNCWLYAMLIEQLRPRPVEDEAEVQVVNIISIVPSRSRIQSVFRRF